jgi:hypothetical protein
MILEFFWNKSTLICNMAALLIGKWRKYVTYKHLYYILNYFLKKSCKDDKFIHSMKWSSIL